MKRFVFAVLRIIDFIESIPSNILFAFAVAWLVISWPFELLKLRMRSKRVDKAFRKGYSSFYSEGE